MDALTALMAAQRQDFAHAYMELTRTQCHESVLAQAAFQRRDSVSDVAEVPASGSGGVSVAGEGTGGADIVEAQTQDVVYPVFEAKMAGDSGEVMTLEVSNVRGQADPCGTPDRGLRRKRQWLRQRESHRRRYRGRWRRDRASSGESRRAKRCWPRRLGEAYCSCATRRFERCWRDVRPRAVTGR